VETAAGCALSAVRTHRSVKNRKQAVYEIAGIKKPLMSPPRAFCFGYLSFSLYFVCLHAFLALHSDEGYFLAFFEAFEAVALNSAEMDEQIRTALWSDKTKTFLVVKPLDGTALTLRHFLIPWSIN
jgi:hypothetical protein